MSIIKYIKIIKLIIALLVGCGTVMSQGVEDFEMHESLTASYLDGSFTNATSGIVWTYGHARNEGIYPIDDSGIMLRQAGKSFLEATFPDGLGEFHFQYRKAYTGTAVRQLELLVNGEQVATTPKFGTVSGNEEIVYDFSCMINADGPVTLRIKNVGTTATNRQTIIDNIAWSAYESEEGHEISFPYSETFDNTLGDWYAYESTEMKSWKPSPGGAYIDDVGTNSGEYWLISPCFEVLEAGLSLSFHYASRYSGNDIIVKMSTDYLGSGDPGLASWTELNSFTSVGDMEKNSSGDVIVMTSGKVYFALVSVAGSSASDWYVSDFLIDLVPSDPKSLDAPVANAATNITSSGFTANWNPVNDADVYELSVYTKEISINPATDLFISEYVEGGSYNKYIEIYNGTGVDVDLSDYRLELFNSGATSASISNTLSGTLANNEVKVYQNSRATLPLPEGIVAENNSAVNFNGDDVIALFKISTETYVDIFGCIGEDPGTAWGDDHHATVNKTLVRNATVSGGLKSNPESGFPALLSEWDVYNQDCVDNLGTHEFSGIRYLYNQVAGSPFDVSGANHMVITNLDGSNCYCYTVIAKNADLVSEPSNEVVASVTTNIATHVNRPSITNIYAHNSQICFSAPAGERVVVYNSIGQQLVSMLTTEGLNTISIDARGVLLVKVGKRIAKVLL